MTKKMVLHGFLTSAWVIVLAFIAIAVVFIAVFAVQTNLNTQYELKIDHAELQQGQTRESRDILCDVVYSAEATKPSQALTIIIHQNCGGVPNPFVKKK